MSDKSEIKIAVIGGHDDRTELLLALAKRHGVSVVTGDEILKLRGDPIIELLAGVKELELGSIKPKKSHLMDNNFSFRGGSKKKGGKTKYPNRYR